MVILNAELIITASRILMYISPSFALLLFATLLCLRIATTFFTILSCLDRRSSFIVSRNEASEVLEFLPLVIHCAATERKWSNEFRHSERALLDALFAVLCQHPVTSLFD